MALRARKVPGAFEKRAPGDLKCGKARFLVLNIFFIIILISKDHPGETLRRPTQAGKVKATGDKLEIRGHQLEVHVLRLMEVSCSVTTTCCLFSGGSDFNTTPWQYFVYVRFLFFISSKQETMWTLRASLPMHLINVAR